MLVHAALGRLEKPIAARRVAVDVDLPPELPEVVADPELLGVAVEYALDFAVARSPDKAVHVTGVVEGGRPVIRVADAGGAIDPAALAHIFDPFVEKDLVPRPEPGARRRERLGLGLAIARGILAAQGGEVEASISPEGDGVVLTLLLGSRGPRAAAAE
jgi:C4-dicarboxylate-specific signal transduction histidine kinase